jgi:hypothetical protein
MYYGCTNSTTVKLQELPERIYFANFLAFGARFMIIGTPEYAVGSPRVLSDTSSDTSCKVAHLESHCRTLFTAPAAPSPQTRKRRVHFTRTR